MDTLKATLKGLARDRNIWSSIYTNPLPWIFSKTNPSNVQPNHIALTFIFLIFNSLYIEKKITILFLKIKTKVKYYFYEKKWKLKIKHFLKPSNRDFLLSKDVFLIPWSYLVSTWLLSIKDKYGLKKVCIPNWTSFYRSLSPLAGTVPTR